MVKTQHSGLNEYIPGYIPRPILNRTLIKGIGYLRVLFFIIEPRSLKFDKLM